MGYMTFTPGSFKSSLSLKEILEKYEEFKKEVSGGYDLKKRNLDVYTFDKIDEDKDEVFLTTKNGDYYAKFDNYEDLCHFISTVIQEGSHCVINFDGDDGRWGYIIEKGKVSDIDYVAKVGDALLEEYIVRIAA